MFSGILIDAHYDDGTRMVLGCDDKPITLKIGDAPAETYWAKEISRSSDGVPTFKLLPMEHG